MTIPLSPTNFFTYYMFHPEDKSLSTTDSKIAIIANAAILLLTLGTVHLVCYCFFYNRAVVQLQEKNLNLLNKIPHPTHPSIEMGVSVTKELPENVSIELLPLNESKAESDLSQYNFKLILNPKIPVDSPPQSYGEYSIILKGEPIKTMKTRRPFKVEILDTTGKIKVEGDGYYILSMTGKPVCSEIAVVVDLLTTQAEYTFKFRYA